MRSDRDKSEAERRVGGKSSTGKLQVRLQNNGKTGQFPEKNHLFERLGGGVRRRLNGWERLHARVGFLFKSIQK